MQLDVSINVSFGHSFFGCHTQSWNPKNTYFLVFPMIFLFLTRCLVLRGADQQSALQLWQVDGKSHLWCVASLQGLGCDFWPKNHLFFFVLFFWFGNFWRWKGSEVFQYFFLKKRSPAFSGGFISFIPWISRHVRGVSRKSAAEAGKSNQNKDTQVDFILTTPTFSWLVSNIRPGRRLNDVPHLWNKLPLRWQKWPLSGSVRLELLAGFGE